jgi:hypothetical protein
MSFDGFMLALPHAEAIVGLRAPVFQVVYNNFVTGVIPLDAKDLAKLEESADPRTFP